LKCLWVTIGLCISLQKEADPANEVTTVCRKTVVTVVYKPGKRGLQVRWWAVCIAPRDCESFVAMEKKSHQLYLKPWQCFSTAQAPSESNGFQQHGGVPLPRGEGGAQDKLNKLRIRDTFRQVLSMSCALPTVGLVVSFPGALSRLVQPMAD
jgi:hypothetical protein